MKRTIGNPLKMLRSVVDYGQSCGRDFERGVFRISSYRENYSEGSTLRELKGRTSAPEMKPKPNALEWKMNYVQTGFTKSISVSMISRRMFSTSAENDSSDIETVKAIYDRILDSITKKRTAPPNALLWSFVAKCSSKEDIGLLYDILQKLRIFRLSNLRIHEDFNTALCREITKACVRAGAIDFGMKALWKHNVYGLTPDIGSAHHLLLHAKENNDVDLLVQVMKLVKKNELAVQPGTADIVLSICANSDRSELMSKYGKRFVKSGVKLRQTSFDIWMDFAVRKGDAESLWKIEKWRFEAMKKHSLSTAFSCAKGFLLEDKPENAAEIIQMLTQTLPDKRVPDIEMELEKLANNWPLELRKEKDEAFVAKLQGNIVALMNVLRTMGVDKNITIQGA